MDSARDAAPGLSLVLYVIDIDLSKKHLIERCTNLALCESIRIRLVQADRIKAPHPARALPPVSLRVRKIIQLKAGFLPAAIDSLRERVL